MAIFEMVGNPLGQTWTDTDGHGHGPRIWTSEYLILEPGHGLGHGFKY